MKKRDDQNILLKIKASLEENIVVRNVVLAISLIIIVVVLVFWALNLLTRHGQRYTLPDFSGMSIAEAHEVSKELDIEFEITDSLYVTSRPKGSIIEQYPKPGNYVKKGRRVFLTTNAFNPKLVPMPYVAGFSLRQAKNKIVGAGFVIDKITYREDLATFNVLEQQYKGKKVTSTQNILGESGSGVTLIVGLNPVDPEVAIPNLAGLTVEEAKNRVWESGFNIVVNYDSDVDDKNIDKSKIYSQSPQAARRAMHGRTITINVSSDDKKVSSSINEIKKDIAKYEAQLRAEEEAKDELMKDSMSMDEMLDQMNSELGE